MADTRDMTKTNITIPTDLLHRLDTAADRRGLSRWKLAEILMEDGLSRLAEPEVAIFRQEDPHE